MFDQDSRFTKLGNDIYVYKNFLSQEEIKPIIDKINGNIDLWSHCDPKNPQQRNSIQINETMFINEKLKTLIDNKYFIKDHSTVVRLKNGDEWGLHSDNHDYLHVRELSKNLKANEEFELVDNNIWGVVIYFNNFKGGEIFYPEQNIEYKPMPGDLVIHSSDEHCIHGVRPVLSDFRYSYSNAIYETIKIPKTK
jgi:hypothetical protein